MPLNPRFYPESGHTVWLIGASTGIGLSLARKLHQRGVQVVVSARKARALDEFVLQHPGSLALPLDVTDRQALEQAAQTVDRTFGRLDAVVFLAGIYEPMSAPEFDLDKALQHMKINMEGAMNTWHAVRPIMLKQKTGHLSWVSSVAGFRGLPLGLAYGPTKAALTHFAECLYVDLKPLGLSVSVIHPGFVQTPLTAGNTFHMPALIGTDEAAQAMLRGWEQGAFEIHFPKRFTCWMKLMRILPYALYFPLVRRLTQKDVSS
jgi:NAD(P)-dependent dehydrogenase (short-subunit alcohol dehydrogenase family)